MSRLDCVNFDYTNIGNFVTTAMLIISTAPYVEIIDNVFDFIEKEFIGKERDVVISMLAERVNDIENIDSKARVLKFIQEHRKDDCDEPEIVLK